MDHETIPLSPKGNAQALEMAQDFNLAPNLIITSRFTRTQQTALPLVKKYQNVSSIDVWASVNEFTYLNPTSCINTTSTERKARRDEYWQRCDPDYKDGFEAEIFNGLLRRARSTIERLKKIERDFIVVFTHALFMQVINVLLTDNKEDVRSLMARFRDLPQFDNCDILKWHDNNCDYTKDEADLEKNLPKSLQHEITQLLKGIKNNFTNLDCFFNKLETSINSAVVDRVITEKQAAYLRDKYL